MLKVNSAVKFCLVITKFQTELSRRLDSRLGGLGFNEFIVLYHLYQADDHKMRRTDLAEAVGLTPSAVTRMLLPMEKIGLVKREIDRDDARVSYVVITGAGKTKYTEGMERMEIFCEELIPAGSTKKLNDLTEFIGELGKNI